MEVKKRLNTGHTFIIQVEKNKNKKRSKDGVAKNIPHSSLQTRTKYNRKIYVLYIYKAEQNFFIRPVCSYYCNIIYIYNNFLYFLLLCVCKCINYYRLESCA